MDYRRVAMRVLLAEGYTRIQIADIIKAGLTRYKNPLRDRYVKANRRSLIWLDDDATYAHIQDVIT
jgi:hypothetical protein